MPSIPPDINAKRSKVLKSNGFGTFSFIPKPTILGISEQFPRAKSWDFPNGETDIPAMKMMNYQGGASIAVYNPNARAKKGKLSPKQVCQELITHGRASYIAPADYSEGSELYKLQTSIIDKIALELELKKHTQV